MKRCVRAAHAVTVCHGISNSFEDPWALCFMAVVNALSGLFVSTSFVCVRIVEGDTEKRTWLSLSF